MANTTLIPLLLSTLAICVSLAIYLLTPRPHTPTLERIYRLAGVADDISRERDLSPEPNEEQSGNSAGRNGEDANHEQEQRPNITRKTSIHWSDSENEENLHVNGRVHGHIGDGNSSRASSSTSYRNRSTRTRTRARTPSPLHPPFNPDPSPRSHMHIHTRRIFFSPLTPITPLLHTLHRTTPPLSARTIQTILRQHIIASGLAFADPEFRVPINLDGSVSIQYREHGRAGQRWGNEASNRNNEDTTLVDSTASSDTTNYTA
ncbi:hypothetical protein PTT_05596 [Pyrenophora teres f. teres 0-1]|uniref:Uncharacterized protein n=1 Tax=Pyrenophora teres f. teres (strain 0-1) TaxID=861557 RepID=E3RF40_PYRTT|nr:hypothetical protein PTT_05596 [Pyrenophora teres f. teres 0-1]